MMDIALQVGDAALLLGNEQPLCTILIDDLFQWPSRSSVCNRSMLHAKKIAVAACGSRLGCVTIIEYAAAYRRRERAKPQ